MGGVKIIIMFNECERKNENENNKCVNINVFAECDKNSEKCEIRKEDNRIEASCVNINVFAECEKEQEKKHDKCCCR